MVNSSKVQEIADNNAGRAATLIERAGVSNPELKKKIQKLIYHTADDVALLFNESGNR